MDLNLEDFLYKLHNAIYPENLFNTIDSVKSQYRTWASIIHPDKLHGNDEPFKKLSSLYKNALEKIEKGTYGVLFELSSKKKTYKVTTFLQEGSVSDVYLTQDKEILKISKASNTNIFLRSETESLISTYKTSSNEENMKKLFPVLLDSFTVKKGNQILLVNVFEDSGSDRILLKELYKIYPDGLDFRDSAWIFKRMLAASGFAHKKGIIHAGILPDHIFIHPIEHGIKLIDWCWSVKSNNKSKAIIEEYEEFYPSNVILKKNLNQYTDIYMICMCIKKLTKYETEIFNFLDRTLQRASSEQGPSAWDIHDQFKDLLFKLVGPPKYRILKI